MLQGGVAVAEATAATRAATDPESAILDGVTHRSAPDPEWRDAQ